MLAVPHYGTAGFLALCLGDYLITRVARQFWGTFTNLAPPSLGAGGAYPNGIELSPYSRVNLALWLTNVYQ